MVFEDPWKNIDNLCRIIVRGVQYWARMMENYKWRSSKVLANIFEDSWIISPGIPYSYGICPSVILPSKILITYAFSICCLDWSVWKRIDKVTLNCWLLDSEWKLLLPTCGPGKPGRSWNFILAFSRTGKSLKRAAGPGKFWESVKLG